MYESFQWGRHFETLSDEQRDVILLGLIGVLTDHAWQWLNKVNLKPVIDRQESPSAWISAIFTEAHSRSAGIVEQHLVGAKLAKRHPERTIPNHPAHAADLQTSRPGDFEVSGWVYHVTANPGESVIEKCKQNIRNNLRPILLVPHGRKIAVAEELASQAGIEKGLSIASIESFIALNLIELAIDSESGDLYSVFSDMIELYNQRLLEAETDKSLTIEISE